MAERERRRLFDTAEEHRLQRRMPARNDGALTFANGNEARSGGSSKSCLPAHPAIVARRRRRRFLAPISREGFPHGSA